MGLADRAERKRADERREKGGVSRGVEIVGEDKGRERKTTHGIASSEPPLDAFFRVWTQPSDLPSRRGAEERRVETISSSRRNEREIDLEPRLEAELLMSPGHRDRSPSLPVILLMS